MQEVSTRNTRVVAFVNSYFMVDSRLSAIITAKTFRLTLPNSNVAAHEDFNIQPRDPENVLATVHTAINSAGPILSGRDVDEYLVGSLSLLDKLINGELAAHKLRASDQLILALCEGKNASALYYLRY
ncbi:hypothetical protein ElyMa_006432400 [Elysia marginata]|uniref:Uncharacterized protein n=1 Tax=Elysia marginata TaxID=1093978 RepID=A0AAV4HUH7_9GAST|nr:hypothetical protein ElyMa_006432400 [Elysia marginata]